MPSTSDKQRRTMAAAAHDPAFAKKVGIPQKVAKEFNAADQAEECVDATECSDAENECVEMTSGADIGTVPSGFKRKPGDPDEEEGVSWHEIESPRATQQRLSKEESTMDVSRLAEELVEGSLDESTFAEVSSAMEKLKLILVTTGRWINNPEGFFPDKQTMSELKMSSPDHLAKVAAAYRKAADAGRAFRNALEDLDIVGTK